MGCSCCRMIKRAIYDPSVPVDIHGRKRDPAGSSLYQPNRHHHLPGDGDPRQAKQGFHNLGYSTGGGGGGISVPTHPHPTCVSNAKFDNDNNHINYRLHGNAPPTTENANSARTGKGKGGGEIQEVDSGVKVPPLKQSQGLKNAAPPPLPSVPPVYQLPTVLTPTDFKTQDGSMQLWDEADISRDGMMTSLEPYHLHDALDGVVCCVDDDEEERESGVGSTPDYLVDTGDEASVFSGDINTSSTSLSSADTREDRRGWRREPEGGEEHHNHDDDDCQSVTDSMVAEALAALEAATAGEDDDD